MIIGKGKSITLNVGSYWINLPNSFIGGTLLVVGLIIVLIKFISKK